MTSVKNKKSYLNHGKFLDLLWEKAANGGNQRKIRLVSLIRSDKWLGNVDDDWFGVFFPDCHLLSDETQKQFAYGFGKLTEEKNVNRLGLLDDLVDACLAFRSEAADVNFNMYQLGDFMDLWREEQRGDTDYQAIGNRILNLTAFSGSKFYANRDDINFIMGNHDQSATEIYEAKKAYFPVMKNNKYPLLVTHGDVYDKLEALDDDVQKYILNLVQRDGKPIDPAVTTQVAQLLLKMLSGKITASNRYDIIDGNLSYHRNRVPRVLQKDEALNLRKTVNVRKLETDLQDPDLVKARDYHQLLAGYPDRTKTSDLIIDLMKKDTRRVQGMIESVLRIRKGDVSPYEKSMKFHLPGDVSQLPDLKMVVVGHSHCPGLVTVGDPGNDGFLLMDCGAWIEEIKWPVKKNEPEEILPSCQFGVLCGNEARVYQIDP